jgi:hypothetical protein
VTYLIEAMATSATEQEAGGETALQQKPHSFGETKPGNQVITAYRSALFTSRAILMSNGPGYNRNSVLCIGSLVTGLKAAKTITGNGIPPLQMVTT